MIFVNKKIVILLIFLTVVFLMGCTETPVTEQTYTLVDEQFTVPANSMKSYYADLEAGDEIQVLITVLEGGNLDIDFYITDANDAKIISRSRIGQSTVSWKVPYSGTYYFVYDNSFSMMTSKIVKTTIKVTS